MALLNWAIGLTPWKKLRSAAKMTDAAIYWPIAGHLALILLLYAMLTVFRALERASKDVSALEGRVSANLSNQFEAPLLFYVVVVLMVFYGMVGQTEVLLAWVFLGGRVLHTAVQVSQPGVILRGIVFTVNFLAIYALWGIFLWRMLMIRVPAL